MRLYVNSSESAVKTTKIEQSRGLSYVFKIVAIEKDFKLKFKLKHLRAGQ